MLGNNEQEIIAGQPASSTIEDTNQIRMGKFCRSAPGSKLRIRIARARAHQFDGRSGCAPGDFRQKDSFVFRSAKILIERKTATDHLPLPLSSKFHGLARARYCLHRPELYASTGFGNCGKVRDF